MPGTQKARRPPTCCTRATGVRLCGRARVRLARLVSDCPDHTLPAPALNLFTSFIQTSGRGRVKRPEVPAAISSSLMQVCSRAMAESGESSVSEVRQSLKELRKLRELRKLCFDHPGPVTGAHFAVDVLGGEAYAPVASVGKPGARNKRKQVFGAGDSPPRERRRCAGAKAKVHTPIAYTPNSHAGYSSAGSGAHMKLQDWPASLAQCRVNADCVHGGSGPSVHVEELQTVAKAHDPERAVVKVDVQTAGSVATDQEIPSLNASEGARRDTGADRVAFLSTCAYSSLDPAYSRSKADLLPRQQRPTPEAKETYYPSIQMVAPQPQAAPQTQVHK